VSVQTEGLEATRAGTVGRAVPHTQQLEAERRAQPGLMPRAEEVAPPPGWPGRRELEAASDRHRRGEEVDWNAEVVERIRFWTDALERPEAWLDFRPLKAEGDVSAWHADLVRLSTGDAVWIDSFFRPHWLPERLEAAPEWRAAARRDAVEERWRHLLWEPGAWLDQRSLKDEGAVSDSEPDFLHEASGEGLYLGGDGAPEDVLSEIGASPASGALRWRRPEAKGAEPWMSLFSEPGKWRDFRALKASGQAVPAQPDFVHSLSAQGLWLDLAPAWIAARIASKGSAGADEPFWPEAVMPGNEQPQPVQ